MAKEAQVRTFRVEVSTVITVAVNEAILSDWDGKSVLDPTSERWRPGMTQSEIAGSLAVAIGCQGIRVGGSDGFAYLPPDTAVASGSFWADEWSVDSVEELSTPPGEFQGSSDLEVGDNR